MDQLDQYFEGMNAIGILIVIAPYLMTAAAAFLPGKYTGSVAWRVARSVLDVVAWNFGQAKNANDADVESGRVTAPQKPVERRKASSPPQGPRHH